MKPFYTIIYFMGFIMIIVGISADISINEKVSIIPNIILIVLGLFYLYYSVKRNENDK